jgi:hypothetical protein
MVATPRQLPSTVDGNGRRRAGGGPARRRHGHSAHAADTGARGEHRRGARASGAASPPEHTPLPSATNGGAPASVETAFVSPETPPLDAA